MNSRPSGILSLPRGPASPVLTGPRGFYLRNLVRVTCLLPKTSKWSPRKSSDKSEELCVQGCSLQNCL